MLAVSFFFGGYVFGQGDKYRVKFVENKKYGWGLFSYNKVKEVEFDSRDLFLRDNSRKIHSLSGVIYNFYSDLSCFKGGFYFGKAWDKYTFLDNFHTKIEDLLFFFQICSFQYLVGEGKKKKVLPRICRIHILKDGCKTVFESISQESLTKIKNQCELKLKDLNAQLALLERATNAKETFEGYFLDFDEDFFTQKNFFKNETPDSDYLSF